ncbi:MAG: 3-methyl-2-oxobutanoate dehydrogenase subunit beta, partial [Anaerolineales bacterium]
HAFELAEKYRTIVVILADGNIGQMMEPAVLPPMLAVSSRRAPWALTGSSGRPKNLVSSIHLKPEDEEEFNGRLQARLADVRLHEVRFQEYQTDDAEIIVVGFGTAGRVAQTAVKQARLQGIPAGLLRPISLYPFPDERLAELALQARGFLVVEMNAGQMVEDVRRAVAGRVPVGFYGRMGGMVPMPDDILARIHATSQLAPQGNGRRHAATDLQREGRYDHASC